ncbi:MAG: ketoacyl-ACP synthase III [Legionella sp.]|nr:ketoacyl-ACP synthase III [Legionella sp.]
MPNAVISGTGSYLPKRVLTNAQLETMLDTSDEWIQSRSGISNRRIADASETTSFMASAAAIHALEASGIDSEKIDMILVATCTPDHFFPNVACHVQQSLKTSRTIPALDINVACSGFIYALDVAKQYITAGAAKHVLVIGSETMSKTVDWTDRTTCVLFGDGAGAVVLSAGDEPGILGSVLHASFDEKKLLTYENYTMEDKKSLVGMKGNEVFKIAVNLMSEVVDEILAACKIQASDITWLVPHQANIRIIHAIAKKLSMPLSQVVVTIQNHGNTSAASIPLALDTAVRASQIKRGDVLLLESFGGGIAWGATAICY